MQTLLTDLPANKSKAPLTLGETDREALWFCACVSPGLPEAGPREADPAGAGQQAVPPAGPGEPHGRLRPSEGAGHGGEPALGRPAAEGGGRAAPTQGDGGAGLRPHSMGAEPGRGGGGTGTLTCS